MKGFQELFSNYICFSELLNIDFCLQNYIFMDWHTEALGSFIQHLCFPSIIGTALLLT